MLKIEWVKTENEIVTHFVKNSSTLLYNKRLQADSTSLYMYDKSAK